MEPARCVGQAFFPLDKQLGLLGSGITPRAEELAARLGTWMPFADAQEMLEELVGVQVCEATARRATLSAGAAALAVCEAETARLQEEVSQAPQGATKQMMSSDGAFVPLVGGVWMEVKTLVLGKVTRNQKGEVCSEDLSSFSRLMDVKRFEEATLWETHRRRLEKAQEVCAVQDGAEWLAGVVDYHCAQAVRILDFAHAAERIAEMEQAARSAGSELVEDWLSTQLHDLKHAGPAQVLADLRVLTMAHPTVEVLRENLAYLQKREAQMQYPGYQAAGWPIGSGSVESANKVVVEARLKGAGMHWQQYNVNPMLVLRNAVSNERWPEIWTDSWIQRQQRRTQRREERSQQRLRQACWLLATLLVRAHSLARPPALVSPTTTAAAPRQASTSHPRSGYSWRQPFLRRLPSPAAVPGGLRAKK